MSDAEHEGTAQHLLCAAGVDPNVRMTPRELARLLGAVLSPTAPKGLCGMLEGHPLRIRYHDRGHPAQVNFSIAHELAHLAAEFADMPRPHDERDIDRIAEALLVPRQHMLRAIYAFGWDAERLCATFSDVAPRVVFARAARVAEGIAVVRVGASRVVIADEGAVVDVTPALEERLVRLVRAHGRPTWDPSGVSAWPFVDVTHRAGVVLLGATTFWSSACAENAPYPI